MRVLSCKQVFCLLVLQFDGTVSLCNLSAAQQTRRNVLGQFLVVGSVGLACQPQSALAAVDCMTDCLKNCKKIAPKDSDYCVMTCKDYCAQDDRTDGLSGSVSAASGEVGILGGTFGQGTVAIGDDRPPRFTLPGLDFTTSSGKRLIDLYGHPLISLEDALVLPPFLE